MRSESVAIPLDGATTARVALEVSVGELRLAGGARDGRLVEGTVELPDGVELRQDVRPRGTELHCALSADFERRTTLIKRDSPRWDVRLAPGTPLELDIESGASAGRLDLTGLTITQLDIDAGVGKTEVTLPARGQLRARLKSGVGETILNVPGAMAARLRISSGIGSIKVDPRFARNGQEWQTPGYLDAAERADIRIEAGVGSIVVRVRG
jgi:hypothetical protein